MCVCVCLTFYKLESGWSSVAYYGEGGGRGIGMGNTSKSMAD